MSSEPLTIDGAPRVAIVATLGDDTGGGLYVLEDGAARQLDGRTSGGLAVTDGRIARALPNQSATRGELVVYDADGPRQWYSLPELVDVHDVMYDGDYLVVVSSMRNAVTWLDRGGEVVRDLVLAEEPDAWHVNCLVRDRGRILAGAFGRFPASRGWAIDHAATTGLIFDLETGDTVVGGLCCPHHVRRCGEHLLVCNSRVEELVVAHEDGCIVRRIPMAGWTRGMAVADDVVLVGESSGRKSADVQRPFAAVAVLDRATLEVRERIALPDREIYDVALVDPNWVSALEVPLGFDSAKLVQPNGTALEPADRRVTLTATPPRRVPVGTRLTVTCEIVNRGSASLASMLPHPVQLGYRIDGIPGPERSPLWGAIRPGQHALITLEIPLERRGRHQLSLSCVQEHIAWFDDDDPASGWSAEIEVV